MQSHQNHTELEVAFAAVILDQFGLADLDDPMQLCRALQAANILSGLIDLSGDRLRGETLKTLEGLCITQADEAQFLESLLVDKDRFCQPDRLAHQTE